MTIGTAEIESANSKARILELLRHGEHSVVDVSDQLGLARNTVRTHLTSLEHQNMVRRTGVRKGPGAGKPAHLFQLTEAAQAGFSKAYIPLLQTVLATLADQMDQNQFIEFMDEVGRRLSPEPASEGTPPATRLAQATSILESLGATLTTARTNGSTRVEGAACPLGAVVAQHHLVCRAIQTMLSRILGVDLITDCVYDGFPACRFHDDCPQPSGPANLSGTR